MSAAEKILALADYSELNMPSDYIDRLDVITDVLPLIADVVEAAEELSAVTGGTAYDVAVRGGKEFSLRAALTALEEALGGDVT